MTKRSKSSNGGPLTIDRGDLFKISYIGSDNPLLTPPSVLTMLPLRLEQEFLHLSEAVAMAPRLVLQPVSEHPVVRRFVSAASHLPQVKQVFAKVEADAIWLYTVMDTSSLLEKRQVYELERDVTQEFLNSDIIFRSGDAAALRQQHGGDEIPQEAELVYP